HVLVANYSVLVDQEHSAPVHAILSVETVIQLGYGVIVVLKQWEREFFRFRPRHMREDIVAADCKQLSIEFRKIAPSVPEGAHLGRSAGRPVGGVKCQDDIMPALLGELQHVSEMVSFSGRPRQPEIGRSLPDCRTIRGVILLILAQRRKAG